MQYARTFVISLISTLLLLLSLSHIKTPTGFATAGYTLTEIPGTSHVILDSTDRLIGKLTFCRGQTCVNIEPIIGVNCANEKKCSTNVEGNGALRAYVNDQLVAGAEPVTQTTQQTIQQTTPLVTQPLATQTTPSLPYKKPKTLDTVSPSCRDTDALDYQTYGTITGVNERGLSYRRSDKCVNEDILEEQYCKGIMPSMQQYSCKAAGGNCFDGLCEKTRISEETKASTQTQPAVIQEAKPAEDEILIMPLMEVNLPPIPAPRKTVWAKILSLFAEPTKTPCKDCTSQEARVAGLQTKLGKLQAKRAEIQRHIDYYEDLLVRLGDADVAKYNYYGRLQSLRAMLEHINAQILEISLLLRAAEEELLKCMNSPLPPCSRGEGSSGSGAEGDGEFITDIPPECYDSDLYTPWPEEVGGYVRVKKPNQNAKVYKDSCTEKKATNLYGTIINVGATAKEWYCKGTEAASMDIVCLANACNYEGSACEIKLSPPKCGDRKLGGEEQCDPPGIKCYAQTVSGDSLRGECGADCKCIWKERIKAPPKPPKPEAPPEPPREGPPPEINWDELDK